MVTSRRRRAAAGMFVVALLAGCSGEGDDGAEATPSAADTGVVTWAEGVCSATTDLEAAVQQVTAALQVDPAADASALDQAKAEVAERAGAVRGAADDLRAAVNTSPPGVLSQEAAAARQELSATADQARTAAEELATKATAVVEAQTPADTAAALTAAGSALAAAGAGVRAYLTELSATVESRDPVLREAFAEAPACQSRQSSASPTSS